MNECWVSSLLFVLQVFDPAQETISCLCVRSLIPLRHALFYLCNSHGERVYIVLIISNLDLAAAYALISQNPIFKMYLNARDSFSEIDCN